MVSTEDAGTTCPVHDSLRLLPPCVSKAGRAWLLDFGSGEIGVYAYVLQEDGRLVAKGSKHPGPFFASFVEPWKVAEFSEVLLEQFKLGTSSGSDEPEEDVSIFAGATGLHREMFGANAQSVARAHAFLGEVGGILSEKLGAGRGVTVRLFVPSGLLEAQMELHAAEWLVSRSHLLRLPKAAADEVPKLPEPFIRLAFQRLLDRDDSTLHCEAVRQLLAEVRPAGPQATLDAAAEELLSRSAQKDEGISFDEFHTALLRSLSLQMLAQMITFSGTLSAGGGSSQITTLGGSHTDSMELFSAAVGNRVPLVEGLFSKPVTAAERETWRARVKTELGKANFPTGLCGLFVGISAVYYAVKAARLDSALVDKASVLAGLAAALEKLDPEDQRSIANLILAHEVIEWAFDDHACFVFKRDWNVDGANVVATWTLGLFTQQHHQLAGSRPAVEVAVRGTDDTGSLWKVLPARVLYPTVFARRQSRQTQVG